MSTCTHTPPHCLKEHDLMLCVFHLGLMFAFGCFEELEALPHSWCRYLSLGRSISHQSGSSQLSTPTWKLLAHFTPPFHLLGLASLDPVQ